MAGNVESLIKIVRAHQHEVNLDIADPACEEINRLVKDEGIPSIAMQVHSMELRLAEVREGRVGVGEEVFYTYLGGTLIGFVMHEEPVYDTSIHRIGALIRPFVGEPVLWAPVTTSDFVEIYDLPNNIDDNGSSQDIFDRAIEELAIDQLELPSLIKVIDDATQLNGDDRIMLQTIIQHVANPIDHFDALYPEIYFRHASSTEVQYEHTYGNTRFPVSDLDTFMLITWYGGLRLAVRKRPDHVNIHDTVIPITEDMGYELNYNQV